MTDTNMPMTKAGKPTSNNDGLLDDIKKSIIEMQSQMQQTYSNLGETRISGFSHDKTIEIIMTATYQFVDVNINPKAFANSEGRFSQKEFEWRLREAWTDLSKRIQETTQSKTIELLQKMQVPEEIKNITQMEEEGEQE